MSFPFGGAPANPPGPMPTHGRDRARAATDADIEAAWHVLRDLALPDDELRTACNLILDNCQYDRCRGAREMLRLLEKADG